MEKRPRRCVGRRRKAPVRRINNVGRRMRLMIGTKCYWRRLVEEVEDEEEEIGAGSEVGRLLVGAEEGEHVVAGEYGRQVVVKVLKVV